MKILIMDEIENNSKLKKNCNKENTDEIEKTS
jgi:hypothetical protein